MKTKLEIGKISKGHVAVLTLEDEGMPSRPRHHCLLLDCSGSMSGSIGQVRKDAVSFVTGLNEKDHVSVIIFSGHNQSRIIVLPTRCNAEGKKAATSAIEKNVRVLDTTVFSEPLQKAVDTVASIATADVIHAVTLFTDGVAVPTRWDPQTERNKTLALVAGLADLGAIVNVIGYGVHYDDVFLSEVMEIGGNTGIYRHVSDIGRFGEVLTDLREVIAATTPKRLSLQLVPNKGAVRRIIRATPQVNSVSNGSVEIFSMYEGKTILFAELTESATALTASGSVDNKVFNFVPKAEPLSDESRKQYLFVAAAAEYLFGSARKAQELLKEAGALNLANRAGNAYSERERREVADTVRRVYRNREFIGAGIRDFGPNNNVLNVLRLLIESDIVATIPRGAYERSGLLVSDPRIIQGGDRVLEVIGYSSHSSRLNFNIKSKKNIQVLPEGGGKPINTQQFVDYNLILDGNLHLDQLEVSGLTRENFDALHGAGVINGAQYGANRRYTLDLAGVPLVSPVWANPRQLGLVPLLQEEADLETYQSALNARLKVLPTLKREDEDGIDAEGMYHPKAAVVEDVVREYYDASCVEIRLLKYKAVAHEDISRLSAEKTLIKVKEVRRRLRTVRFIIRAITFAMEATESQVIPWGSAKTTQRGKYPKEEREANFDGALLREVRWTEQVVCS